MRALTLIVIAMGISISHGVRVATGTDTIAVFKYNLDADADPKYRVTFGDSECQAAMSWYKAMFPKHKFNSYLGSGRYQDRPASCYHICVNYDANQICIEHTFGYNTESASNIDAIDISSNIQQVFQRTAEEERKGYSYKVNDETYQTSTDCDDKVNFGDRPTFEQCKAAAKLMNLEFVPVRESEKFNCNSKASNNYKPQYNIVNSSEECADGYEPIVVEAHNEKEHGTDSPGNSCAYRASKMASSEAALDEDHRFNCKMGLGELATRAQEKAQAECMEANKYLYKQKVLRNDGKSKYMTGEYELILKPLLAWISKGNPDTSLGASTNPEPFLKSYKDSFKDWLNPKNYPRSWSSNKLAGIQATLEHKDTSLLTEKMKALESGTLPKGKGPHGISHLEWYWDYFYAYFVMCPMFKQGGVANTNPQCWCPDGKPACTPSYTKEAAGSDPCMGADSHRITTEAECKAAATKLGLKIPMSQMSENHSGYPKGCYENDGMAYLNNHASGKQESSSSPICKSSCDVDNFYYAYGQGVDETNAMYGSGTDQRRRPYWNIALSLYQRMLGKDWDHMPKVKTFKTITRKATCEDTNYEEILNAADCIEAAKLLGLSTDTQVYGSESSAFPKGCVYIHAPASSAGHYWNTPSSHHEGHETASPICKRIKASSSLPKYKKMSPNTKADMHLMCDDDYRLALGAKEPESMDIDYFALSNINDPEYPEGLSMQDEVIKQTNPDGGDNWREWRASNQVEPRNYKVREHMLNYLSPSDLLTKTPILSWNARKTSGVLTYSGRTFICLLSSSTRPRKLMNKLQTMLQIAAQYRPSYSTKGHVVHGGRVSKTLVRNLIKNNFDISTLIFDSDHNYVHWLPEDKKSKTKTIPDAVNFTNIYEEYGIEGYTGESYPDWLHPNKNTPLQYKQSQYTKLITSAITADDSVFSNAFYSNFAEKGHNYAQCDATSGSKSVARDICHPQAGYHAGCKEQPGPSVPRGCFVSQVNHPLDCSDEQHPNDMEALSLGSPTFSLVGPESAGVHPTRTRRRWSRPELLTKDSEGRFRHRCFDISPKTLPVSALASALLVAEYKKQKNYDLNAIYPAFGGHGTKFFQDENIALKLCMLFAKRKKVSFKQASDPALPYGCVLLEKVYTGPSYGDLVVYNQDSYATVKGQDFDKRTSSNYIKGATTREKAKYAGLRTSMVCATFRTPEEVKVAYERCRFADHSTTRRRGWTANGKHRCPSPGGWARSYEGTQTGTNLRWTLQQCKDACVADPKCRAIQYGVCDPNINGGQCTDYRRCYIVPVDAPLEYRDDCTNYYGYELMRVEKFLGDHLIFNTKARHSATHLEDPNAPSPPSVYKRVCRRKLDGYNYGKLDWQKHMPKGCFAQCKESVYPKDPAAFTAAFCASRSASAVSYTKRTSGKCSNLVVRYNPPGTAAAGVAAGIKRNTKLICKRNSKFFPINPPGAMLKQVTNPPYKLSAKGQTNCIKETKHAMQVGVESADPQKGDVRWAAMWSNSCTAQGSIWTKEFEDHGASHDSWTSTSPTFRRRRMWYTTNWGAEHSFGNPRRRNYICRYKMSPAYKYKHDPFKYTTKENQMNPGPGFVPLNKEQCFEEAVRRFKTFDSFYLQAAPTAPGGELMNWKGWTVTTQEIEDPTRPPHCWAEFTEGTYEPSYVADKYTIYFNKANAGAKSFAYTPATTEKCSSDPKKDCDSKLSKFAKGISAKAMPSELESVATEAECKAAFEKLKSGGDSGAIQAAKYKWKGPINSAEHPKGCSVHLPRVSTKRKCHGGYGGKYLYTAQYGNEINVYWNTHSVGSGKNDFYPICTSGVGKQTVSLSQKCSIAANQMGLQWGGKKTDSSKPNGCIATDGTAYYNDNLQNSKERHDTSVICKRATRDKIRTVPLGMIDNAFNNDGQIYPYLEFAHKEEAVLFSFTINSTLHTTPQSVKLSTYLPGTSSSLWLPQQGKSGGTVFGPKFPSKTVVHLNMDLQMLLYDKEPTNAEIDRETCADKRREIIDSYKMSGHTAKDSGILNNEYSSSCFPSSFKWKGIYKAPSPAPPPPATRRRRIVTRRRRRAKPPNAGPGYVGCYADDGARAFRWGPKRYGYSRVTCMNACKPNYYVALQHGGWCSCDNTYARFFWKQYAYKRTWPGQCNMKFPGGGGKWRNAVYVNQVYVRRRSIPGYKRAWDDANASRRRVAGPPSPPGQNSQIPGEPYLPKCQEPKNVGLLAAVDHTPPGLGNEVYQYSKCHKTHEDIRMKNKELDDELIDPVYSEKLDAGAWPKKPGMESITHKLTPGKEYFLLVKRLRTTRDHTRFGVASPANPTGSETTPDECYHACSNTTVSTRPANPACRHFGFPCATQDIPSRSGSTAIYATKQPYDTEHGGENQGEGAYSAGMPFVLSSQQGSEIGLTQATKQKNCCRYKTLYIDPKASSEFGCNATELLECTGRRKQNLKKWVESSHEHGFHLEIAVGGATPPAPTPGLDSLPPKSLRYKVYNSPSEGIREPINYKSVQSTLPIFITAGVRQIAKRNVPELDRRSSTLFTFQVPKNTRGFSVTLSTISQITFKARLMRGSKCIGSTRCVSAAPGSVTSNDGVAVLKDESSYAEVYDDTKFTIVITVSHAHSSVSTSDQQTVKIQYAPSAQEQAAVIGGVNNPTCKATSIIAATPAGSLDCSKISGSQINNIHDCLGDGLKRLNKESQVRFLSGIHYASQGHGKVINDEAKPSGCYAVPHGTDAYRVFYNKHQHSNAVSTSFIAEEPQVRAICTVNLPPSRTVQSAAECQSAMNSINGGARTSLTWKGEESEASWPAGCYKLGTNVYYNTNANGRFPPLVKIPVSTLQCPTGYETFDVGGRYAAKAVTAKGLLDTSVSCLEPAKAHFEGTRICKSRTCNRKDLPSGCVVDSNNVVCYNQHISGYKEATTQTQYCPWLNGANTQEPWLVQCANKRSCSIKAEATGTGEPGTPSFNCCWKDYNSHVQKGSHTYPYICNTFQDGDWVQAKTVADCGSAGERPCDFATVKADTVSKLICRATQLPEPLCIPSGQAPAPPPAPHPYVKAAKGAKECPTGSEFITSQTECQSARSALVVSSKPFSTYSDADNYPHCYEYHDASDLVVYHNAAGNTDSSTMATDGDVQLLCKRKSQAFKITAGTGCVISSEDPDCVTSENYPDYYSNNRYCHFELNLPGTIQFQTSPFLDIAGTIPCGSDDYLTIKGTHYCGKHGQDTSGLGNGNNYPSGFKITLGADELSMQWKTNNGGQRKGWKLCRVGTTPAATPSPTPQATPSPTPEPTTAEPTAQPTPQPTPQPTTPQPTPQPTPEPTAQPTPQPTPEPTTPQPTAQPTPEPTTATYVRTTAGAKQCPTGYEPIRQLHYCFNAVMALGLESRVPNDGSTAEEIDNKSPACYDRRDSYGVMDFVYYNKLGTTDASVMDLAQFGQNDIHLLCQKTGLPYYWGPTAVCGASCSSGGTWIMSNSLSAGEYIVTAPSVSECRQACTSHSQYTHEYTVVNVHSRVDCSTSSVTCYCQKGVSSADDLRNKFDDISQYANCHYPPS